MRITSVDELCGSTWINTITSVSPLGPQLAACAFAVGFMFSCAAGALFGLAFGAGGFAFTFVSSFMIMQIFSDSKYCPIHWQKDVCSVIVFEYYKSRANRGAGVMLAGADFFELVYYQTILPDHVRLYIEAGANQFGIPVSYIKSYADLDELFKVAKTRPVAKTGQIPY